MCGIGLRNCGQWTCKPVHSGFQVGCPSCTHAWTVFTSRNVQTGGKPLSGNRAHVSTGLGVHWPTNLETAVQRTGFQVGWLSQLYACVRFETLARCFMGKRQKVTGKNCWVIVRMWLRVHVSQPTWKLLYSGFPRSCNGIHKADVTFDQSEWRSETHA